MTEADREKEISKTTGISTLALQRRMEAGFPRWRLKYQDPKGMNKESERAETANVPEG